MNKRGEGKEWILPVVILAIVVIFFIYVFVGNPFSSQGGESKIIQLAKETTPFSSSTIWGERAKVLDYTFGGIPNYLLASTSPTGSAIIMIGLWLILLLTFGDILTMFGFYNKTIAWVIAIVLTIVAANLKVVSMIAAGALGATAFLGVLSTIIGIGSAFVLFILFHFGTSAFRRRLIIRRAEDHAMRVTAGGKKMAAAAGVLKKLADEAEKDED